MIARLLVYNPSFRLRPLAVCAHAFFDELRKEDCRLPNGRDLPQLFNFTEQGIVRCDFLLFLTYFYNLFVAFLELSIQPSLNQILIPPRLLDAVPEHNQSHQNVAESANG